MPFLTKLAVLNHIGLAMLALALGCVFSAQAQVIVAPAKSDVFYVRLAGRVVDRDNGRAIAFASVFNRTNKKGARTDSAGFFTIVLSNKDTLELRHIGYRPLYYVKPPGRNGNYFETFTMQEEAVTLKEVIIYRKRAPLNTIALNPDWGYEDKFHLHPFGSDRPRTKERASISSPITAIYEQFSKRERNLRKLEQLKSDKQLRDLASIRYNEYYVESLTGLKGQDLAAFMGYCPLQPNFIITSSDYELAAAVLNCYRRFMNDL